MAEDADEFAPNDPVTPEEDEKVGYCRPPKRFRFREGIPGNPNGREKGSKNMRTILRTQLKKVRRVKHGNKTKSLSQSELLISSMFTRAINGDTRASALIVDLLKYTGEFAEQPSEPATLSAEDQRLLNRLLDELGGEETPKT